MQHKYFIFELIVLCYEVRAYIACCCLVKEEVPLPTYTVHTVPSSCFESAKFLYLRASSFPFPYFSDQQTDCLTLHYSATFPHPPPSCTFSPWETRSKNGNFIVFCQNTQGRQQVSPLPWCNSHMFGSIFIVYFALVIAFLSLFFFPG